MKTTRKQIATALDRAHAEMELATIRALAIAGALFAAAKLWHLI